jgi:hypothetical protein
LVFGGLAIVLAVGAAIVVTLVLSEGEQKTAIFMPAEETSAPASTPTQTPVPLEGVRARALSTLTVRAGPGTGYISLGIVRRGAELEVIGRNEEETWLEISYPPRSRLRGWVTIDGVEMEESVASLPVATPESLALPAVPTYPPGAFVEPEAATTPTPAVPPGPDLILSDAYVLQGELVVTITNQGIADATGAPIDVAIYSGDGSILLRLARAPDALPAGASVDLPTQYQPAGGPQRLLLRVDPANRVEEMNEGNNEVLFGVSGLPPTPTATWTPTWRLPSVTETPTAPALTPTATPTEPAPYPGAARQSTPTDER